MSLKKIKLKNKSFKFLKLFGLLSLGSFVLAACVDNTSKISNKKYLDIGQGDKFSDAEEFSLANVTKEILKLPDSREKIINLFAKNLIYNWYQKQIKISKDKRINLTKNLVKDYEAEVDKVNEKYSFEVSSNGGLETENGRKNVQRMVLDKAGGNSALFKKDLLADNLVGAFKNFFSTPNNFTFTYKKDAEYNENGKVNYNAKSILNSSFRISKEDLENSDNWNKIQYFPLIDQADQQKEDTNLLFGRTDFHNFVFDKWFEVTRPFNVVMSLWKYSEKADKQKLNNVYNATTLGNDFPTKADYKFPVYDSDQKDSDFDLTETKFKRFATNLDKLTPTDQQKGIFSVPKAYTDDSATSIYVKGNSIFNDLYPQFAAGSVHKFNQLVAGSDITNKEEVVKNINPISKAELQNKTTDLINLFLKNAKAENELGINIDKSIFNSSSKYKDSTFVMDQRDVKETPWMFLRNKAGVHAVAIDGYNYIKGTEAPNSLETAKYLERSKNFFKFRIVQSAAASNLKLKNAIENFNPLKDVNDYSSKNFNSLIVDYYLNNIENTNSIFSGVQNPIKEVLGQLQKDGKTYNLPSNPEVETKFKELLKLAIDLNKSEPKLKALENQAEKLKSEYSELDLEFKKVNENYYSNYKNGLASVLPYELDIDYQKEPNLTSNNGRYKVLAPFYASKLNYNFGELFNYDENSDKNYKGLNKKWNSLIDDLFSLLQIKRSQTIEYPAGQQTLLTNVDLFNQLLVEFNSNKDNVKDFIETKHLQKYYLSDLYDWKTNKIKEDAQLGNSFNSLTGTGKLPLNEMLNNQYYSSTYLASKSPVDFGGFKALKDDGSLDDADKVLESFNKKQTIINAEKNFLESNNGYKNFGADKKEYYDFLKSLVYLSTNNFENLRLYLQQTLSNRTQAAFVWNTKVKKENLSSLTDDAAVKKVFSTYNYNYKNQVLNPYINPQVNLKEAKTLTEEDFSWSKTSNNYDAKNALADQNFKGFKGLYILDASSGWTNKDGTELFSNSLKNFKEFTNSAKNGILFNFGNKQSLKTYINNFSSASQVDSLAKDLQKNIASLNIDAITRSNVSVAVGGKTVSHSLTFYEKRHALTFLIFNNKMLDASKTLTADEFKKMYGSTPNSSEFFTFDNNTAVPEPSSTDPSYSDNIPEALFNRFTGYLQSTSNANNSGNKYAFKQSSDNDKYDLAYMIQINSDDVSTKEKFAEFSSKYLGDYTFTNFLINLAKEKTFQNLAITDYLNSIPNNKMSFLGITWYDAMEKTAYINNQIKEE